MQIPKLTDISAAWAAALLTDAAINAWCETTFGKRPTILDGMDPRNRPGKGDCPLIVIDPEADDTGLFSEEFSYSLELRVGVYSEQGGRGQSGDDDRLITYAAKTQAEHLAALALNCLAGTDWFPQRVQGELIDDFYPLVIKYLSITTATEVVSDGDRTW